MSVEVESAWPVHWVAYLAAFDCRGAECEDTCCAGWSMQVDPERVAAYAVAGPRFEGVLSEEDGRPVLRRDGSAEDACNFLESRLCSIQLRDGNGLLPDACHFYPRVLRRLGDEVSVSAVLSCPEVTRLALYGEGPMIFETRRLPRLPVHLPEYPLDTVATNEALALVEGLVRWVDDTSVSPERVVVRLVSLARGVALRPMEMWPTSVPMLMDSVDTALCAAKEDHGDLSSLLQVTCGLQVSTGRPVPPRLQRMVSDIEAALGVTVNWETLDVHSGPGFGARVRRLERLWRTYQPTLDRPLRRWLQAQILFMNFPFAGLGEGLPERAQILALRFAILRLGLMGILEQGLEGGEVVRVTQTCSRLLEHLSDPELPINLMHAFGWDRCDRLRALVGDFAA